MDEGRKQHLGIILTIYLVGLLIGGLYVGMVAPVRTVVQLHFGINDATGIWMINIYTLFYAALIPVIGKIADDVGRKPVFMVCVLSFMLGAALCGISARVGGFWLLLVGRVIQAVGACGLIPVANAAIGTTFPQEKRGMALGLAAATSGIANVLGSVVGSAILAWVGSSRWDILFYWSIPVCLILAGCAKVFLPASSQGKTIAKGPILESASGAAEAASEKSAGSHRLDIAGSVLFVLMVVLILLGLRNLDFFDMSTLARADVYAPIIGAVICILVFGRVEKRAENPVFHLEYLRNRSIVVTLAASFFIGCMVISMTMIPEFTEFVTHSPAGSGGYYMAAIGIFSMVGPIISGKLIDKRGPKRILLVGLAVACAGYVFLGTYGALHAIPLVLVIGLSVVGMGMGFAIGAPTNYMILESTSEDEATAAIATVTLVRQIGTSLAPAILVGFIANATVLGFQRMLLCVAVFTLVAAIIAAFYRSPRR